MLKTLNIPIDIFDTSVLVLAGTLLELSSRYFSERMAGDACAMTFEQDGKIVVMFDSESMAKHGKTFWRKAIVHESVHAACCVLKQKGTEISYANQELIAYLTDYIDSKIAAWLPMPTRKTK
jgi:hypothetical protein